MKYKLIEKKKEIGNIYTFVFEPEKSTTWLPGQYIHYILDHPNPDERGIERWFTISSIPAEKNISLTTRKEEKQSSFKKHLFNLKVGQMIVGDKPEGEFVLTKKKRNKDLLFLAGGIGITPFRSSLLELDRKEQKWPKVTLLYANRDEKILFQGIFDELAIKHPEFTVEYFVGENKLDQKVLKEKIKYLNGTIVYLSGPKAFFSPIKEILLGMGLPIENLLKDFFPGYNNY